MREWRAAVEYDPITQTYAVRLGQDAGDGYDVATSAQDGIVTMQRYEAAVEIPRFLSLPRGAVEALREAFEEHAPRPNDADLRDALAVERGRVDRMLDRLLSTTEAS